MTAFNDWIFSTKRFANILKWKLGLVLLFNAVCRLAKRDLLPRPLLTRLSLKTILNFFFRLIHLHWVQTLSLSLALYPPLAPLYFFSSPSLCQRVRSEAPGKVVLHNVWVLARPHLLDEVSMVCVCVCVCVCARVSMCDTCQILADCLALLTFFFFSMEMFPHQWRWADGPSLCSHAPKHTHTHTHARTHTHTCMQLQWFKKKKASTPHTHINEYVNLSFGTVCADLFCLIKMGF